MVLHLPHADGGFGVTLNDITKDTAYVTTSHFVSCLGVFYQERQGSWLPKDDLKDSSSWSSPPLLAKYDWKDMTSPPAQPGTRTRPV